ncbi:MAG: helix-turn-helix transcriptional regulator [Hyphomonas sp.]|nr:helix-turn-helix transcriptional regulator [Hyphomonas sp.]MDP3460069.1 helix-turn-helix transcriptional regulator [Hyphomonas sp.]
MERGPYTTTPGSQKFRIRQERKRAGLTQSDLAEAMDKDDSTISRWERGQMDFSVGDLIKIAEILGCAPGRLISGGDGLRSDERELVEFLRSNPQDAKILLSTYEALRAARRGEEAA